MTEETPNLKKGSTWEQVSSEAAPVEAGTDETQAAAPVEDQSAQAPEAEQPTDAGTPVEPTPNPTEKPAEA